MRQRGVADGPSSLYSLVSALHLASADVGKEGMAALQELLMSQMCILTSLDLSSTAIDGWALIQALRGNATVTSLDVRRVPGIASMFEAVGDLLLQEGGICRIGYMRCDAYDILEGDKVISLRERVIGQGAAKLLAGLLKHNDSIVDLDLTATDLEKVSVEAIAAVFAFNEALTVLRLTFNPQLDGEAKAALTAAAEKWKPTLRLEL